MFQSGVEPGRLEHHLQEKLKRILRKQARVKKILCTKVISQFGLPEKAGMWEMEETQKAKAGKFQTHCKTWPSYSYQKSLLEK